MGPTVLGTEVESKTWRTLQNNSEVEHHCSLLANGAFFNAGGVCMLTESIKDLFDPQCILHVGKMRDKFFTGAGDAKDITGVRDEILLGWKLTYENGYRFPYFQKPVVHDLDKRIEKSAELMEIAVPYMEKLHSFLQHDSFWVTLLDADGVILKLVGADKMLAELAETGLVEGSDRGSNAPYCGLFHLVYILQKPFILVSTEHASTIDDNLAGAACPILDSQTKKPIGFIAVSGHWWDSHIHTLGLAIIAAEAISQQLTLKRASRQIFAMNKSINKMNHRLHTTIESINSGIVYFNEVGKIKTISRNAVRFLGIKKDANDVLGTNILLYLDKKITMKKIFENTKNGKTYRYDLTATVRSDLISQGEYPLYCFIKLIPNDDHTIEYIMQLSKRDEAHLQATNMVYSKPSFRFDDIIGTSQPMMLAKKIAALGAKHNPAILITGESGTGKELFAQAIHNASDRACGPLIAINCGAIPRSLIESELFGYEKGAFTGADKGHPGKFELANGGTLFLDEIGDMPYDVQVTLLRVLQTKEVLRIGGVKPVKIDVRVISATNKNLQDSIRNRTFRDDLYYRLNVFTITLPPLRDRGEDIELLARYFLDMYNRMFDTKVKTISSEVLHCFNEYSWPGNIRELENVIERSLIICQSGQIEIEDLPASLTQHLDRSKPVVNNIGEHISEKDEIILALRKYGGNLTQAAKYIGLSRPTLYKRMKIYHINKNAYL
jgi:transcriptional regulator with PAS, ATPase and Fis domain